MTKDKNGNLITSGEELAKLIAQLVLISQTRKSIAPECMKIINDLGQFALQEESK